tara:strand:+ start:493 stop:921 length:429 start_codon:yes stop_codon:yes gene_type:complete
MKDIHMIDDQIDVMLWLEDSLSYVTKWRGKDSFFKQFNSVFIATYNRIGKYGVGRNRILSNKDVLNNDLSRKRAKALLEVLWNTTDYSDNNLLKGLNELGMEIGSAANVRYYLGKLVKCGAVMHLAPIGMPRDLRKIKKTLD